MTARLKYSYDIDLTDSSSAATRIIRLVGEGKRILEVGAGPGSIARILKTQFACDVTAVELDGAAVDELETFCDRVVQVDLNDSTWVKALAGVPPFQFVIAADVLEHLLDPLAVLKSLKGLLADGGRIVVSLPNAAHNGVIATLLADDFHYGESGLLDRTHLRFFGIKNVDPLFAAAGLEVIAREYVNRQPSQTEFAEAWNRLPAELREPLSRKPYGNAYQVILMARPKGCETDPLHEDRGRTEQRDKATSRGGRSDPANAALPAQEPGPGASLGALMVAANAAHEAGDLVPAKLLFERVIREYGENFDALHLLGVIDLQNDRAEHALPVFLRALPLLKADFPPFFRNLGLCLAAVWRARNPVGSTANDRTDAGSDRIFRSGDLPELPRELPQVSVIVRTTRPDVDATVASVDAQTYPNIDLVLIDSGSLATDSSQLERLRAGRRVPIRYLRSTPGDGCAALNQAVAGASGQYVGLLEADDLYAPARIESMVRLLSGTGARWGFSNLAFVDASSRNVVFGERPDVDESMRAHAALLGRFALSEGVMQSSHIAAGGNLLFERGLWQEIGGFKPLRFHGTWLFSLSASLRSEPVYLDEPDYIRRIGSPPASDAEVRARAEEESMVRERWLAHLESARDLPNQLLERAKRIRKQRDFTIMANGGGHLLDRPRLLRYASELSVQAKPDREPPQ